MRVKIHDRAKTQFGAWRRSLGATQRERAESRKRLWEEFVENLRRAGGPPPGSVPAAGTGVGRWWVAFPENYLALVEFRITRVFFGWFATREAIVLRFNFSPGLPDRVG